jgi:DNA-binding GntR family transcriptional regulator
MTTVASRSAKVGRPARGRPTRGSSQTLAESIRFKIETLISNGRYPPGARLDEQEVAESFGVSRTPVREAIRLLAADNLVELRGRQGTVVRTIRAHDLLEMFQVMAELEGLSARLAARRMDATDRAALQKVHARLIDIASTGDIDAFYDANVKFHEVVLVGSRNEFLIEQTRHLRNRVDIYRRRVTYVPNRLPDTIVEHEAVMNAILAGDAEGAHRLMRDHVNLLGDTLTDFLAVFD